MECLRRRAARAPYYLYRTVRCCHYRCASAPSCVISPQALSILMLPHNIPPSLNLLTSMVDDMWHYAGDQSTDVSALLRPTEGGDGCVKHFLQKFVKFL